VRKYERIINEKDAERHGLLAEISALSHENQQLRIEAAGQYNG
jgi:hypothetical protein